MDSDNSTFCTRSRSADQPATASTARPERWWRDNLTRVARSFVFDPFDLDVDVTPETTRDTLGRGEFQKALAMAFRWARALAEVAVGTGRRGSSAGVLGCGASVHLVGCSGLLCAGSHVPHNLPCHSLTG